MTLSRDIADLALSLLSDGEFEPFSPEAEEELGSRDDSRCIAEALGQELSRVAPISALNLFLQTTAIARAELSPGLLSAEFVATLPRNECAYVPTIMISTNAPVNSSFLSLYDFGRLK